MVSLLPKRFWRLYEGIGVLTRDMERLLEHCNFASLTRRESLSRFGACYSFVRRGYVKRHPLWPSVAKELRAFKAILILLRQELDQEWPTRVVMTDACELAHASVAGGWPAADVEAVGQWEERWRYKSFGEATSRAT